MPRRTIGIALYTLGMLVGGALLVLMLFFPALMSRHPEVELEAMMVGALCALPPLLFYLWVPWIVDRYDPEPAWALTMALAWGAIAACGFSGAINSLVDVVGVSMGGKAFGQFVAACVSAPLVEEGTKGFAVFFMFYFMKREFDGVVDGVIYATFAALGFAAVENVLYYGNAAKTEWATHKEGLLASTFVVRGLLAPWGHPLYTSMTGIGFGIARETTRRWQRWLAPLAGYALAVLLHFTWNLAATISNALFLVMLPIWLLFVLGFSVLVTWLVMRKGKIIRNYLRDEVLMGNLTPWELSLVTSPIASMRATLSFGGASGRRFVATASRLALSKWHAARATRGRSMTVSADMIVPLRQELFRLRNDVSRSLGRAVQSPEPWRAAPGMHPHMPPPRLRPPNF